jgi:hypothetical protein
LKDNSDTAEVKRVDEVYCGELYQPLVLGSPIELPDLPVIGRLQIGIKLPNIFTEY